MIETGEVRPGGSITGTYQMDEKKRLMLREQWAERVLVEQARRLHGV